MEDARVDLVLIGRGSNVYCVYRQKPNPVLQQEAEDLMNRLPEYETRAVNELETRLQFYIVGRTVSYIAVTTKACSRNNVFNFLAEVAARFERKYPGTTAASGSPADFGPELTTIAQRFNEGGFKDKTQVLKEETAAVTAVMTDNVQSLINRGERLERLNETTGELHVAATTFKDKSATLRRNMCKRHYTTILIIGGIVGCAVLILVVVLFLKLSGGDDDDDKKDGPPIAPPVATLTPSIVPKPSAPPPTARR